MNETRSRAKGNSFGDIARPEAGRERSIPRNCAVSHGLTRRLPPREPSRKPDSHARGTCPGEAPGTVALQRREPLRLSPLWPRIVPNLRSSTATEVTDSYSQDRYSADATVRIPSTPATKTAAPPCKQAAATSTNHLRAWSRNRSTSHRSGGFGAGGRARVLRHRKWPPGIAPKRPKRLE